MKFWPAVLARREQASSVIPLLLASQDRFIGILQIADASPLAWECALSTTTAMPANLFLKHLIVLSDVGGEKLQRYRRELTKLFPKGVMTFRWNDSAHRYSFASCGDTSKWTNQALNVAGPQLPLAVPLSSAMRDVAMLLLHAGACTDPGLPDDLLNKCMIGSLIGRKRELDRFVRERYIQVSRITGGATANAMGQLCQEYVRDFMRKRCPGWDFTRHTIPGISHNAGRTDMAFDLVARSPGGRCCAIEVSFQVTTNSTIERKAGQAADRQRLLHKAGHRIAYVIDGAGNFQRRAALTTICQHSDCTVTFKDRELDRLARFLDSLN